MDTFGVDSVKSEKAKAIGRFNRLRQIANLVRVLEACAVLVLLSCSSTCFQNLLAISGEDLRRILAVATTPRFVFLIGNAIVLAVFAKARQASGDHSEDIPAVASFCDAADFGPMDDIKNVDFAAGYNPKRLALMENPAAAAAAAAEASVPEVEQIKQIVTVENAPAPVPIAAVATADVSKMTGKKCQRSRSESFQRDIYKVPPRELCRSETAVIGRESETSGEFPAKGPAVDELSSEEFRQTVEAFINKNRSLMRKESMDGIVTN